MAASGPILIIPITLVTFALSPLILAGLLARYAFAALGTVLSLPFIGVAHLATRSKRNEYKKDIQEKFGITEREMEGRDYVSVSVLERGVHNRDNSDKPVVQVYRTTRIEEFPLSGVSDQQMTKLLALNVGGVATKLEKNDTGTGFALLRQLHGGDKPEKSSTHRDNDMVLKL